ncbi:MAG: TlpA family protein disulfide reductase [Chitinophagaceae bacterium]|nr:TlpA family protein disulfide reductase [Chitinophagaceae bacterium]
MRTLYFLLILFSSFRISSLQAQQRSYSNEVLKLLSSSQVLQTGSGNLQNKFVLLDFWATWCGPCIAALPDLEKLQEKYRDSLHIISVSDEKIETVQRYLSQKDFKATTFICDTSRGLFKYFGVVARPAYFLLDAEGSILWSGQLQALDKIIPELMQNNDPQAPPALRTDQDPVDENPALFSLRYNIAHPSTPYSVSRQLRDTGAVQVKMQNSSFTEIVSLFTNILEKDIISYRPDLDSLSLDLFLACAPGNHTTKSIRAQVMGNLQQSLNFTTERIEKKIEGFELSSQPALLEKYLDDSEGGGYAEWKNDSIHFWRLTPAWLGESISKHMSTYVQAKCSSGKKYTFTVPFRQDMAELVGELEKFGLRMKRKKIRVMQVEIR